MISREMKEKVMKPSAIRAMFEKGNQLKKIYGSDNVYDFSLGNPNLSPPERVNETIMRLVVENKPGMHGYMPNAGYEYVRELVADQLNAGSRVKHHKDGIIMTCGAAAGMNVIFKSILDPGDEVIAVAPFFVEYKAYVENSQGRLVVVDADRETFLPEAKHLHRFSQTFAPFG